MRLKLFIAFLFIPAMLLAQDADQKSDTKDVWEPLRFFVGEWTGDISGMPGEGTGERSYQFIMDGTYLEFHNKGTFEPQEKNPKGEVHLDQGMFSYDKARGKFVVRQYHSEGFYNQYLIDSISEDNKTMVFVTESIENGPPGMRARYRITIDSPTEFTEIFELAFPGKEFGVCLTNRWVKK